MIPGLLFLPNENLNSEQLFKLKQWATANVLLGSVKIIEGRHQGGFASLLELITARQALLDNQRQLKAITGQQLANAVFLIKSLVAGWERADIEEASVGKTETEFAE